jgi:TRAP-type C4-dicarboxylate transport system permease small subunit
MMVMGAGIVLVQTLWISYGVFMRYVMNDPDRYVTEATALLLVPVAFAGLGYALMTDAYPKVTLLTDHFSWRVRKILGLVNLAIMIFVGLFFALSACSATWRSYTSGAASEVLTWPKVYFWAPVAVALVGFNFYAIIKFVKDVCVFARGEAEEL